MGAPFLETVNSNNNFDTTDHLTPVCIFQTQYFSGDTDETVSRCNYLLNRQTDLCDYISTWDIIQSNSDFEGR